MAGSPEGDAHDRGHRRPEGAHAELGYAREGPAGPPVGERVQVLGPAPPDRAQARVHPHGDEGRAVCEGDAPTTALDLPREGHVLQNLGGHRSVAPHSVVGLAPHEHESSRLGEAAGRVDRGGVVNGVRGGEAEPGPAGRRGGGVEGEVLSRPARGRPAR
jgi:hypothetical protein